MPLELIGFADLYPSLYDEFLLEHRHLFFLDKSISKKVIKTITITFRDDRTYLQQIRIQELTGDVTTIRFTNTRFNVPLDKKNFEVQGHV